MFDLINEILEEILGVQEALKNGNCHVAKAFFLDFCGDVAKLSKEDYDRLSPKIGEMIQRYDGKLSLNFVAVPDMKSGEVKLENSEKVIDCGLGVTTEGLLDALDMLVDKKE